MSDGYEVISPDDTSNYENINVRGVTGVFINEGGQIAILQHNKFDCWTLPVGKADEGESETDALIREMREELGVDISTEDLELSDRIRFEWTLPGGEGFGTNQIFIVRKYAGEARNIEINKHAELRWVSFEELIELTSEKTTSATKAYIRLLQEI